MFQMFMYYHQTIIYRKPDQLGLLKQAVVIDLYIFLIPLILHYSIMKNKIKLIVLIIFLLLIGTLLIISFKDKVVYTENNPIASSQVPKGTFRNTETGETFDYIDNWGYLGSCNPNCKSVYFDIDLNGNIIQIREVKENPILGKINSFTIDKDKPEIVNYVVEYNYGNKVNKLTYTTELCDYFKGGGKQCRVPAIKDTPVIVNLKNDNNSVIDNIIIFNKILKADLLEIVNVDHV